MSLTDVLIIAALLVWEWARGGEIRGPAWTRATADATGMDWRDGVVFAGIMVAYAASLWAG